MITIVLAACMVLMNIIPVSSAAAITANGKCGSNLTWSLDSQGILSISGSGSMYNYSQPTGRVTSGIAPWWSYRSSIRQVTVGSQVTSVGQYAFGSDPIGEYGYGNLTGVTLGSGVTRIEDYAFLYAYRLNRVNISSGLKTIGASSFLGTGITEVEFPSTLVSIGDTAFSLTKMTSVDIPPSVTSIGWSALGYNFPFEGGAAPLKGFTIYGYSGSAAEKYYNNMLRDYNADREMVKNPSSYAYQNFTSDGTVYFVSLGSNPNGVPFGDVPENAWFYKGVKYVYDKGLMNGVSKGYFAPSDTTTRAMIVTILWRLDGKKSSGQSGFRDVSAGSWYSDAVNWAAANGIVSGYSSSQFGPNDPITREQMAVILYRYAKYCGKNVSARGSLAKYQDRSAISDYAKDAMAWAVGTGLITGVTDTKLDPKGSAVRAQSATILMRFCSL